jgi:hypothetical protein
MHIQGFIIDKGIAIAIDVREDARALLRAAYNGEEIYIFRRLV